VVIASGASYRRLDVPNLREFEGRGIWYWASPIEARLCVHEEIVLVGGGNSAGQAAVFLRDYAAKIWLLVRGPSLSESMSQYLIDRIDATSNIEVLTNTEVVALSGSPQGQLDRIRWRNRLSGEEAEKPIRHLFLFIGADPATDWLHGCVSLDAKGFVQTGASVPQEVRSANSGEQPLSLQSNIPGVFAVGDVRSGSVKRVGAAIGEGAGVVAQLHTYLADTPKGAAVQAASAAELPPGSPPELPK
jgi:thioredoxin reductase (NADPH)